jgi:hypothetical protein
MGLTCFQRRKATHSTSPESWQGIRQRETGESEEAEMSVVPSAPWDDFFDEVGGSLLTMLEKADLRVDDISQTT